MLRREAAYSSKSGSSFSTWMLLMKALCSGSVKGASLTYLFSWTAVRAGSAMVPAPPIKNCIDDPREIAAVTAERTRSEVVKVIGKKIVLFRQAKKNTKYELPG